MINVQMINQPKGKYVFRLINNLGQAVMTREIMHQVGSSIELLRLPKNIVDKSFKLNVTRPDNITLNISLLVE
jgi:hypothetical protein